MTRICSNDHSQVIGLIPSEGCDRNFRPFRRPRRRYECAHARAFLRALQTLRPGSRGRAFPAPKPVAARRSTRQAHTTANEGGLVSPFGASVGRVRAIRRARNGSLPSRRSASVSGAVEPVFKQFGRVPEGVHGGQGLHVQHASLRLRSWRSL